MEVNGEFFDVVPERKLLVTLWDSHPLGIRREGELESGIATGIEFSDPRSTVVPKDCNSIGSYLVKVLEETRKELKIDNIALIEPLSEGVYQNQGKELISVLRIYIVGVDVDDKQLQFWRDLVLHFLSLIAFIRERDLVPDVKVPEELSYIESLSETVIKFLKSSQQKKISNTLKISCGDITVSLEQGFVKHIEREPDPEMLTFCGSIKDYRSLTEDEIEVIKDYIGKSSKKNEIYQVKYDKSEFKDVLLAVLADEMPRNFTIQRQVTKSASGKSKTSWSLKAIEPMESSGEFKLRS